jgi:histidine ammonia-lyase
VRRKQRHAPAQRLTHHAQESAAAAAASLSETVASLSTAAPAARLGADATRAVLFVKAGELIRAKAPPRSAVLRFLTGLLAAGVLPALPAADADAAALATLADACCGHGLALRSGAGDAVPLGPALATAGLTPPGLTPAERAALCAGAAPSVAVAALAVARLRKLLPAAEAVSALSCEVRRTAPPAAGLQLAGARRHTGADARARRQALQSNVLGFEPEAAEACPHKHDVLAASELCALLVRGRRLLFCCAASLSKARSRGVRRRAPSL